MPDSSKEWPEGVPPLNEILNFSNMELTEEQKQKIRDLIENKG